MPGTKAGSGRSSTALLATATSAPASSPSGTTRRRVSGAPGTWTTRFPNRVVAAIACRTSIRRASTATGTRATARLAQPGGGSTAGEHVVRRGAVGHSHLDDGWTGGWCARCGCRRTSRRFVPPEVRRRWGRTRGALPRLLGGDLGQALVWEKRWPARPQLFHFELHQPLRAGFFEEST